MKKFNWYMISTVSGKESVVIEALTNRIIAEEVSDDFDYSATENGPFKIFTRPTLTPKEAEKKRLGENYKIKHVNLYPGYIFTKSHMSDKAWFVIRNTQYVTGLVGSAGKGAKPTPINERQIRRSLSIEEQAKKDFEDGKFSIDFKPGDLVEVIEGPYQGETGVVFELNDGGKNVTIEIESFGKKVHVTLDSEHVQLSDL
ncbi:transcription termination/antitermination protein NusG [Mycoplasma sp. Ms02]|uniref:transcription termination/antitermination protein NusG n=1 Tax=Mycoplasma sp. Ms02 TaxID=353851 RepID=UPI001C8A49C5|nr:transcription termination/antitermination protein NusG [Mycoplasma sp. Ms02]QZE12274.1 transcription termination/antitermination protein NusG [Mycoplasma sp. Ms02]